MAGEDAVARVMLRKGFRLIARNYTVQGIGELDLVFLRDRTIYVVEVRSRLTTDWQSPIESIAGSKRRKVLRTARIFICREGYTEYDVIFLAGCVTHNREGLVQKIEIIPFE